MRSFLVYIYRMLHKLNHDQINILSISIIRLMGCTESKGQTPILYSQYSSRIATKLIEAISTDNVSAVAVLQAKQDFPTDLIISDDATSWTAMHFCCRFDAVCCLDFLLRKSYLENVKRYIYAANGQTTEGLSCLHLCGLWASFKCCYLLLKYGGLSLSLLDDKGRTAEMVMRDNGLTEMAEAVARLRSKEGQVTQWNHQLLHSLTDLSKLRSLQFHRQQFEMVLAKSRSGKETHSLQDSEEARLWEEKAKLQSESDRLFAEIKEKQQQQTQKKRDNQNLVKNSSFPEAKAGRVFTPIVELQELEKTEEILALQRSLHEKQSEIQRLKSDIKKQKNSKAEQILELQSQTVDEENAETKKSLSQLATEFSAYKQQLKSNKSKYVHIPKVPIPIKEYRKGKEAQGSRSNNIGSNDDQSVEEDGFAKLPEKVKERYRKAKENGSFYDQQFPHNESSFGGAKYKDKIKALPSYTWLRPSQFLSPNFVLFDGIEADDVKQGNLGVCYFLAIIAALVRHPERVKEIFAFYDLKIGFYVIKLHTNGRINYVVVDDYIPCNANSKQPNQTKHLYVLLGCLDHY